MGVGIRYQICVVQMGFDPSMMGVGIRYQICVVSLWVSDPSTMDVGIRYQMLCGLNGGFGSLSTMDVGIRYQICVVSDGFRILVSM